MLGQISNFRKKNTLNRFDIYFLGIVIFFFLFLSILIYYLLGSPNLKEMPVSKRIEEIKEENVFQSQISLEKVSLEKDFSDIQKNVYKLILELKKNINKDDIKGHKLIVENSISIGDFKNARISQEKILEYTNEKDNTSELLKYIEISILAANGIISKENKAAIEKYNLLNPDSFESDYYQGLIHAQKYEKLKALKLWLRLSENLDDKDQKKKLIFNQISNLYTY